MKIVKRSASPNGEESNSPTPSPRPVAKIESPPPSAKKTSVEVNGTDTNDTSPKFSNMELVKENQEAIFNPAAINAAAAFAMPPGPPSNVGQSVTFSTRAIENVSDIMDALNISASTSIKYGTIHGNASASFVNENKVLDSQLNYIVSVKVNNDASMTPDDMEFNPIEGVPPERFTEVFGDCFISGMKSSRIFNNILADITRLFGGRGIQCDYFR